MISRNGLGIKVPLTQFTVFKFFFFDFFRISKAKILTKK